MGNCQPKVTQTGNCPSLSKLKSKLPKWVTLSCGVTCSGNLERVAQMGTVLELSCTKCWKAKTLTCVSQYEWRRWGSVNKSIHQAPRFKTANYGAVVAVISAFRPLFSLPRPTLPGRIIISSAVSCVRWWRNTVMGLNECHCENKYSAPLIAAEMPKD